MSTYLFTGATGLLGKHVLRRLLDTDPSAKVHALVRPGSISRLEALIAELDAADRVHVLPGDLTEPGLGLDVAVVPPADHVVHLAAIYDLTVGEEQAATNIDGTRTVAELSRRIGATLHHVSSIAVAGDHRGDFDEDSFDVGQGFPTPYHRTKFEAERAVRETEGLRWRVYRPAVVVGDSTTGEIDKVDGPYYLFGLFSLLGRLPAKVPMLNPGLGSTSIVPVDYVSSAIVELITRTQDDPNNRVFHLVSPRPQSMREVYNAFAHASGAPRAVATIPGAVVNPLLRPSLSALRSARDTVLGALDIPGPVIENLATPTHFRSEQTCEALDGTGLQVPEIGTYADILWSYWRTNLDPDRAGRPSPDGPLVDRHVLITGASSGIGRHSAISVAGKGAVVLLLARRQAELDDVVAEIRGSGGRAHGYVCDLTDDEQVSATIDRILDDHGHVDMVVNNAGRSIRRSIYRSTDRMHDFERTMAVNYFGAVRVVLALLPHMRERGFGHFVNISTAGVQVQTPRFSGYIASKAALDGFTNVVAAETLHDGITFTTIHMPLVATPMITPTGDLNSGPISTPGRAAAIVVRALIERPKQIDDPFGTLGAWGSLIAPGLKDVVMSHYNRVYPDSPAARGAAGASAEEAAPTDRSPAPGGLFDTVYSQVGRIGFPRPVRRAARLIPGAHW